MALPPDAVYAGVLYSQAARDPLLAEAVVKAVSRADPRCG